MEVALLIFLLLLNAFFAMSEMALAASRKARLQVMVEAGQSGAAAAMALHEHPTRWLSTVQVGITTISVLNGIVGESAFAAPLAALIERHSHLSARAAEVTALVVVVVVITFLTIIIGELVPKRIGQMFPEAVARVVARPMDVVSRAARPFVALLSFTTQAVLRMVGLREDPDRSVTEAEIAASLEEGVDAGVIEAHEHQMVRNVFRLDTRQVGSMMIPRSEMAWLDLGAAPDAVLAVLAQHDHARYPVCRGGLDDILGVISAQELLRQFAGQGGFDLTEGLRPAVFLPETLSGMELLEHFRAHAADMVFVVDEYGEVQGLVTPRDALEAIAGEFTESAAEGAWAVPREDGSWLIDGLIPVLELKDRLGIKELPHEERGRYNTLAGLVMLLLGRMPAIADRVEAGGWRFEVVDLDGKRIDRVQAHRLQLEPTAPASAD